MTGHIKGTHDFALQFVRDPSMFLLLGRLTVAVMGALTCLVIFHIGKRVYDWRVGLAAALIGATAYAHALHSHIINVDIGMVLAVWSSILVYLRYEQTSERRWLIAAGVLAGVAIAFKLTGAIVLPALFLAIVTRRWNRAAWRTVLGQTVTIMAAMLVTLTITAPEWTVNLADLVRAHSWIVNQNHAPTGAFDGDMKEAFRLVTTRRAPNWAGYLKMLFHGHNLALTASALVGFGLALMNRMRWPVIWGALIIFFIAIMSSAERGQPEYYLLPIMPCLWLLGGHAIIAVTRNYQRATPVVLASVVALPLTGVVRQNHEWTQPDTRVVAKEWIEANIPSDSKILMDGYQNRFTPSPPLTPASAVIERQVAGVSSEPDRFRAVSQSTLKLYAEAMESMRGPKYDLHTSVWGLAVKDPAYYVQHCFDYVITSSIITRRYADGINRERFPRSAQFYERLESDPQFRKVYFVEPVDWQREGPVINVYKVAHNCASPSHQQANSQH